MTRTSHFDDEIEYGDHTWTCCVTYDWSKADREWFEIRRLDIKDENDNAPDVLTATALEQIVTKRIGQENFEWTLLPDD